MLVCMPFVQYAIEIGLNDYLSYVPTNYGENFEIEYNYNNQFDPYKRPA